MIFEPVSLLNSSEDRTERGADAAHEDRARGRAFEHEAYGEIGTGVDLRE